MSQYSTTTISKFDNSININSSHPQAKNQSPQSPKLPQTLSPSALARKRTRNSVSESVVELDSAERLYFMEKCTKITENLYLGSITVAQQRDFLRNQLDITHIVNCTEQKNPYPTHFKYIQVKIPDTATQDILLHFGHINEFVRNAFNQKGKVLIYSDQGVSRSAAFLMAFLMEQYRWSIFESFIFVKEKRYIIHPNIGFVRQLHTYGNRLKAKRNTAVAQYQCFCGSCTFILLSPFDDSKISPNPKPCACHVMFPPY